MKQEKPSPPASHEAEGRDGHQPHALVTIITITYNNLPELQVTYESIRRQRCQRFHWLVIDGASTDGTVAWLDDCDMPNLSYISEPDNGIYHAMNKGIARFEQEYCLFLNAGDLFFDEHVMSLVVPILEQKRPIFAYGAFVHGALPGYPERIRHCHLRHRWELLLGTIPCHQTMFYSRRAFDSFRGFDESLPGNGDIDWLLEFSKDHPVKSFLFLGFPLVYYDAGGDSFSHFFRYTSTYIKMVAKEENPIAYPLAALGWCRGAAHRVISRCAEALGGAS